MVLKNGSGQCENQEFGGKAIEGRKNPSSELRAGKKQAAEVARGATSANSHSRIYKEEDESRRKRDSSADGQNEAPKGAGGEIAGTGRQEIKGETGRP